VLDKIIATFIQRWLLGLH